MGRPSQYTKAQGIKVCAMLSDGISLKATCKKLKLSYSMVYRWQSNNDAFKKLSTQAREEGIDAIADACIDIADDTELDPQDKRIRIDTRLRLLGKWSPKKYGDKTQLSNDAGDGDPSITMITRTIVDPKK
jgi:hypothetical protein